MTRVYISSFLRVKLVLRVVHESKKAKHNNQVVSRVKTALKSKLPWSVQYIFAKNGKIRERVPDLIKVYTSH